MAQQKGRTSKADATRRQLLDAAIEVISERGYADTTVERIVEVAGVSKGVAYYHFSSKADIATCILVEGIGEIVDDFVAIAGKAPSAVEALTAMMDSFAATIFRNAGFGRILVSELWRRGREWSEPMRALEERLLAVLRGQIERGQREGSIRGDIDAAFEAVAVVGMVLTVAKLEIPRWLTSVIYLAMGWMALFAIAPLSRVLPAAGMFWLIAGGVLYTVGGVLYAVKRPGRNNPRFGCHEIFHVFIVLGSVSHFILMYSVVAPL